MRGLRHKAQKETSEKGNKNQGTYVGKITTYIYTTYMRMYVVNSDFLFNFHNRVFDNVQRLIQQLSLNGQRRRNPKR